MKKLLYLFVVVAVGFTSCKEDDVIGIENLAKYGSVKVKVEGTRSDDVDFSEEFVLKFIPGDNAINYTSAVYYDDEDAYFEVGRADGSSEGSNYFDFELDVEDFAGTPVFDLDDASLQIGVLTDDKKFFELNLYYLYQYIDEDDITNFSFNPDNGKLTCTIKATVPADEGNNNTGHDLDVTITVDVTVFEYIESDNEQQVSKF